MVFLGNILDYFRRRIIKFQIFLHAVLAEHSGVNWGLTLRFPFPCVASDCLLDRELCTHFKSVIEMYHFGFMRPKSVLRFVRKPFLESSTQDCPFSRTNTTQCQYGLPFSRCHLIAKRAISGKDSHERNGTSREPVRMPKWFRSVRTCAVSDHRLSSWAKMPKELAINFVFGYERPTMAETLAMPQPVRSS